MGQDGGWDLVFGLRFGCVGEERFFVFGFAFCGLLVVAAFAFVSGCFIFQRKGDKGPFNLMGLLGIQVIRFMIDLLIRITVLISLGPN